MAADLRPAFYHQHECREEKTKAEKKAHGDAPRPGIEALNRRSDREHLPAASYCQPPLQRPSNVIQKVSRCLQLGTRAAEIENRGCYGQVAREGQKPAGHEPREEPQSKPMNAPCTETLYP